MLVLKLWRAFLIVLHVFSGIGQLYLGGGMRNPYHPDVRETVRRWYAKMLRLLDLQVQLVGELPHEKNGAVLLIANHISWVDIPLIGALTPVNFLSKAEVASWPVVGTVASKTGTVFISRGSGDTDGVMDSMAHHLNNNMSVLFFPEGTTTDGTKVRRFHKKLFKVCEQADVEICPLLIHYSAEGSHNPLPFVGDVGIGSHFWQLLGHRKLHARVEVLPPLKLDPETVGHQIRGVELAMREKLNIKAG